MNLLIANQIFKELVNDEEFLRILDEEKLLNEVVNIIVKNTNKLRCKMIKYCFSEKTITFKLSNIVDLKSCLLTSKIVKNIPKEDQKHHISVGTS